MICTKKDVKKYAFLSNFNKVCILLRSCYSLFCSEKVVVAVDLGSQMVGK